MFENFLRTTCSENFPHMHINKGALPELYEMYRSVLPQMGGYINEGGHLNLKHFEQGSCDAGATSPVVVETSVKESSVEKEVEVVEEVRKEEVVRSCSSSSVVSGRGGASKESTPSRGGAMKKTPRKPRIAANFGGGPLQ